jgi:hypothetical protein
MTDTSKPTLWTLEDAAMAAFHGGSSSTWRQAFRTIFSDNTLFLSSICKLMDEREDQKQKILDERNQLLEQRDELIDVLGQATTMLAFATHTPCIRPPTQFEDEGSKVVEKCRAALAKCGKVGG